MIAVPIPLAVLFVPVPTGTNADADAKIYSALTYKIVHQLIEGDLVDAVVNNDPPMFAAKPVIYLYPEEETNVSVRLTVDGRLTCTYPAYKNSWQVTAMPDGTLKDKNGQIYNYLYGRQKQTHDMIFPRAFV